MMLFHNSRLRNRLILCASLCLIFSIITVDSLYAHSPGQSYIFLRVYEDKLSGIFQITFRDLNNALGLDTPEVQISEGNLADRISKVHRHYTDNVQFFDGEKELPIRFTGLDTMKLKIGNYLLLEFIIVENASTPEAIDIDYNILFNKDPDHLGLLVIEHYWNANIYKNESQVSLIFTPENRRQQLSFAGYSVFKGFVGVVKLGIKSIWGGTDHVLFIISLMLPAAMLRKKTDWQPVTEIRPALVYVVKIIILFAIAHSLTLNIAAVGLFTLPPRLVASVKAISIAIAALCIIFPIFKRKIGWVAFIFGLFHGFSFANVLNRLGVLSEHMALSLFGFNLGVEIGQVVVICLIFPVLYIIRTSVFYPKIVMRYGAVAMILLSMFWFVDRAFLDINFKKLVKKSWSEVLK